MPSFIYSKVIQPGRLWSPGLMFDTFLLERTRLEENVQTSHGKGPSTHRFKPFCSEVLSLDGLTEFL